VEIQPGIVTSDARSVPGLNRLLVPGLVVGLLTLSGGGEARAAGHPAGPADGPVDGPAPKSRRSGSTRARRTPLGAQELDKLREVLASADPATVRSATHALGETGAPNAALPLIEMLAVGGQPAATVAAIDALKKLRDPTSVEVLLAYAGNRTVDVRRHAVEALGIFADARVVPALMERLGDDAPEVRAASAEALATRGEKSAVRRMLALLKRNDASVAGPLGTLAPVTALPEIAELQGSIDDDNLATTLGELLKRREVSEPVRIDIIKTLARISGAAATTALIEYTGSLAETDHRPSRAEAQKVIDERGKLK